jgi:hypothetical protein
MYNIDYVGVFLSAGVQLRGEKKLESYSDYLKKLIDEHGSLNKNLLITKYTENLKIASNKKIKIISISADTKGALTSLAFSLDHIDNEIPVVIFPTNSQVDVDISKFVESMKAEKCDAGVICFQSNDPNYSYIRVKEGKIIEFKEQEIVGDLATTGIFYFKSKNEIVKCLEWCLINNINTNGIYYLAPSLNYFVCNDMNIGLKTIPKENYHRLKIVPDIQNAQIGE